MTKNLTELSPVTQQFILHWGEMGTRWGVNRTVAQIHALLYLSDKPLNAEDIAATLKIARSSVSTSLRELMGWGIIRVVHQLGDRRDYFQSMEDVWEMFRLILQERKKRETDPTIEVLRECVEETKKNGDAANKYETERLMAMLDFFETMTACYGQFHKIPTPLLANFARMGDKIQKVLKMTLPSK